MIIRQLKGLMPVLFALTAAMPALALTPKQLLTRSGERYTQAKSVKIVYRMTMSMGTMGTMTTIMTMSALPSQGKMRMESVPITRGSGQMAMASAAAKMTVVSDGKNTYTYMPVRNGYFVAPENPAAVKTSMMGNADVALKMFPDLKITSSNALIEGQRAYLLEGTKDIAGGSRLKIMMYISKANNSVIEVDTISGSHGMTFKNTVSLTSEKFNLPLSASLFRFVPPRGVKKIDGGMMGAPGMRK